ncbi:terminase large subunit [Bacillus glycinifermentans]|uniref:terminase large subunit n=1 Tax=Bacillus glycinifermentans TaxID=1664069 RepID=UPI000A6992F6|nr:terminase TerL endonuclease subunit [Bacillus glycinifermentans]MEC0496423.1 terminase large subunit [Bacillus glycinifermentans]MEC0541984.1 terminase large subunit [Bacillus glycinifermentans]MEC3608775.1 terminase large subunit [Bacillus glycinifermentans]
MIERGVNYADLYADQVLKNKKEHCKSVIKVVERYKRMKKRKDVWLDVDEANKVMDFIETFCKHSKGELAGEPIELELWQKFIFTNIYGFYKKDDKGRTVRAVRTVYIQIPRKNGKTVLAAGAATYAMYADGEKGAECFTAATDAEQANIAAKQIAATIQNSPDLNTRTQIYKGPKGHINAIIYRYTINGTRFENSILPLSKNTQGLDGKNPHFVLLDEVHAQNNADMYDVLKSGMGSRLQPLMFIISTAGKGTTSVGLQIYDYARGLLNNKNEEEEDISYFTYITEPDKGDKWDDRKVWKKVNPNWGISVQPDFLESEFKTAQMSAERKDEFLAKYLNIFVRSTGTYFDKDIVQKMIEDKEGNLIKDLGDLSGEQAVIGLDLSRTTDLTCVSINIPTHDENGKSMLKVKQMYFIPDHNLEAREKMENIPYRNFAERGFLTLCPGKTIDYDMVVEFIVECSRIYDVEQVNYDPALSQKVVEALEAEGLTCVETKQYSTVLNAPFDDAEILMFEERIKTDNPLFIYCTENVVADKNFQGLKRPSKKQSKAKIDGFVAFLNAHKETMMMLVDYDEDEYDAMLNELYR